MSDSEQTICIGCGLCCDGTIFHAVDLAPSDDVVLLRKHGAVFVSDGESRRMQQPCPAFDGTCCSVYESRPTACRTYVCNLLDAVSRSEISRSDAVSIIDRAKKLAELVRATFEDDSDSNVIRLGHHGLSTYLGIMVNHYGHEHLSRVFPEAAELIDILRTSFGWVNRVVPNSEITEA